MESGLDERVIVVTGASGGIGAACARELAAEGARLVLHARSRPDAVERLAAELEAATDSATKPATSSADAIAVAADLAREEDADRLVDEAARHFGRIDGVVANAGIWDSASTPIHEMSLERWRRSLDVNLTGTFLTLRAYFRFLARTRPDHASVVIVGSTAAVFGEEGHVEYASAKAGIVHGMTKSLKNEIVRLVPRGRVNAVCPGWTRTAMTEATLADAGAVERAMKTRAIRAIAAPEDIARAVTFLLSDRLAGHVTGEIVTVSAGMEGRLLHP